MSGEPMAILDEGAAEIPKTSNKLITNVIYALQAASFLVGFTLFVSVIVNYLKMSDVRGSWLESHFRWQIRTFWFSLRWTIFQDSSGHDRRNWRSRNRAGK